MNSQTSPQSKTVVKNFSHSIKQQIIFPDGSTFEFKDRRPFMFAVVLKKDGKWVAFSYHLEIEAAHKKITACKNTYALRGSKNVDWYSAQAAQINWLLY